MTSPAKQPVGSTTWLTGCLALLLAACSPPPSPITELTGSTMGTGYSVQLSPPPDQQTLATLQRAIAFARVPADAAEAEVDIRGKKLPARIVSPPFVRNGEAREGIL